MGFLEDIATKLNTAGVVTYPGTASTRTCYIATMPDTPDLCVALYPRSGRNRMLYSGGEMRMPDLHVEVRATTFPAAVSKLEAVASALHLTTEETIGGTLYVVMLAASEMMSLGVDQRNRHIVAQNFELKIAK